MDFIALDISHKALIDSYIKAQRIDSSEFSFLTFYIWRKAFNITFAESHGCLVMQFRDNGYPPSLRFPLGNGDKKAAIREACAHQTERGFSPRFYGLTADMAKELSEMFPDRFKIKATRDYYDYVYFTKNLIELSGKALHSKRNHLNRFKKTYDYKYMPITQGDTDEIMESYNRWLSSREAEIDYYLAAERESIRDIINNFDIFGCKGAKLYANGRLCAFTIGEQFSSDTALIHIEKADMDVYGAYAAINQMFLEKEWSHLKYVNREDDFGLSGLRKAKQSYHPAFMVEKYQAILIGDGTL
ncbi:MAG: hypothetical protein BWY15_01102 [Firmicutes bacterium ADurb.Bin193]|nr:MAG: hypothetical protein BWY15_01102 [Firmicutes bacterium ADurb.Bin193]